MGYDIILLWRSQGQHMEPDPPASQHLTGLSSLFRGHHSTAQETVLKVRFTKRLQLRTYLTLPGFILTADREMRLGRTHCTVATY